jgi:hypothetical protein
VDLIRDAGRGGDQRDAGLVTAGQRDEPFQDAGAAAAVLTTSDDEQPPIRDPVLHLRKVTQSNQV